MSSSPDNVSHVEEGCILTTLIQNTTSAADTPKGLISWETHILIETVKGVILMPLMYLIGAPANLINMAVFFKQGLTERVNFCLFLLAAVDLVLLTFLLIFRGSFMADPFTTSWRYGALFVYMTNENVTGLYGFSYMSMLLSAVIATERCVCVLFPLQIQRCIRTRPFAFILVVVTCVVGFMRFVVTAKYRAVCFYELPSGTKSWRISTSDFYVQNKDVLDTLDGIFYGFFLAMGCPVVVSVTTAITAIKLLQVIRWRDQASTALSSKEIGVTKMLICLSVEFLILSVPLLVVRVLPMFGSQLKYGGRYANTFATLVSLSELCSYTSSSVNFFVYYFTGSRFRETLNQLLGWKSSSIQGEACNKGGKQ